MRYIIIGLILLCFGFTIVSSIFSETLDISEGLLSLLIDSLFGKIFLFSFIVLIVSKLSVRALPFMVILDKLSIFTMVMSILALAYILIFQPGKRQD